MEISARTRYQLILAMCVLVFVVVAFLFSAMAGWKGFLGKSPQLWLQANFDPLVPTWEQLRNIAAVVGALGTLATAVFGIFKALRYAEANMPNLLKECLQNTEDALIENRTAMILAAEVREPEFAVPDSQFFEPHFRSALWELKHGNKIFANANLDSAIPEITKSLQLATRQVENLRQQLATALLLRGRTTLALSGVGPPPDASAINLRKASILDFDRVLDELCADDLHALEARGRARASLNDTLGAEMDFKKLEATARTRRDIVHLVRALRRQGDLLQRNNAAHALNAARKMYDSGVKEINKTASINRFELYERGRIYMAYGLLQARRNRLPSAKSALMTAKEAMTSESTSRSHRHLETIEAALKDVEERISSVDRDDQIPETIGNHTYPVSSGWRWLM